MQIDVVNIEGQKVGQMDIADEVFATKVKEPLLWEAVKAQQAAKRAGTHSTKTRMFVRGGGRKPYRQKGTGNARQGSTRSPNFVGGGVVFGPHPRSYEYSLPKKIKKAALASALSLRAQEKKTDCRRQADRQGSEVEAHGWCSQGIGADICLGRGCQGEFEPGQVDPKFGVTLLPAPGGTQRLRYPEPCRARDRQGCHEGGRGARDRGRNR